MRIIAAQIGARHNYAIPRMLEKSGHLARLYTDSCANKGIGGFIKKITPNMVWQGKVGALLKRQISGIPTEKIYCTDLLMWEDLRSRIIPRDSLAHNIRSSKLFGRAMVEWGAGSGTMVYSMFGEGIEYLRYAKTQGLKIAVEIFGTPIAHRIFRSEREKFPGWEEQDPEYFDEYYERHVQEVLSKANILICPSQFVVNGLRAYSNFDENICCVVPYGCGVQNGDLINNPIPGRVLFVGRASLGKGIHYLAEASNILKKDCEHYEFRVIGSVTDQIRTREECKSLLFFGQIPRSDVIREYMSADVFVLPTLAEGSATVIYEALAAGIPIITTESAGSIVQHEVDGLIVGERNGRALAQAINAIVGDRTKRDAMAKAAREKTDFITEEQWSTRLINALMSVHDNCSK